MERIVTFRQFKKDFREYYKCDEVNVRDQIEAEIVMWDLYDCDLFEFNYEDKTIELWY
ncbi:hypothetical protein [Clostridium sp.]|uniref:hypothetical protein n=1 Tax=Clostridium sp. TaxID=1506 RepID=UPI001D650617|nr:hypothetical protein [Clostridium sp.]MBS5307747.1 hypothetical protein [Clostridium sp.]